MSQGKFVTKSYAADYELAANHPIRVQPETLTLAFGPNTNGDAIGAINNPISAVVSLGRRNLGLRPRMVTFKFDEDAAPEGYEDMGLITLPWLQRAGFNLLTKGTKGTYLGGAVEVVSTSPEQAK